MTVSFNGFNDKALTFAAKSSIERNYPVKISENGTVSQCSDSESFIGFCVDCDGESAVVKMSGYVKAAYTGTKPSLGKATLTSSADGAVKTGSNGTACTVLAVNTSDNTVEFLF